jgi:hypothetical protein
MPEKKHTQQRWQREKPQQLHWQLLGDPSPVYDELRTAKSMRWPRYMIVNEEREYVQ